MVDSLVGSYNQWEKPFLDAFADNSSDISVPESKTLFKSIVALAYGDGELSEEEFNFIVGISARMGLEPELVPECFETVKEELMAA